MHSRRRFAAPLALASLTGLAGCASATSPVYQAVHPHLPAVPAELRAATMPAIPDAGEDVRRFAARQTAKVREADQRRADAVSFYDDVRQRFGAPEESEPGR